MTTDPIRAILQEIRDTRGQAVLEEALFEVFGELSARRLARNPRLDAAYHERERDVLLLRLGAREAPKTLSEIGELFHVTRERIRQIEAKALRKLRHPSRSKKLRDYLE